jgi:hypothetical protein
MNAIRKLLAAVAAVVSIAFIFLALRLVGLTLSNYHPSTVFDRVAPWLVVAVLFGLSFVLMRFADRTLRQSDGSSACNPVKFQLTGILHEFNCDTMCKVSWN